VVLELQLKDMTVDLLQDLIIILQDTVAQVVAELQLLV
jgi:hypothetical protein